MARVSCLQLCTHGGRVVGRCSVVLKYQAPIGVFANDLIYHIKHIPKRKSDTKILAY